MRNRCARVSVIPLLLAAFLLMSFLGPVPAPASTRGENGGSSPPPDQNGSSVVVGVAVVLAAIGIIWWLTRGEKEPEGHKSDSAIEPAPKASQRVPAEGGVPTKVGR